MQWWQIVRIVIFFFLCIFLCGLGMVTMVVRLDEDKGQSKPTAGLFLFWAVLFIFLAGVFANDTKKNTIQYMWRTHNSLPGAYYSTLDKVRPVPFLARPVVFFSILAFGCVVECIVFLCRSRPFWLIMVRWFAEAFALLSVGAGGLHMFDFL
jgi:hypothetical protein